MRRPCLPSLARRALPLAVGAAAAACSPAQPPDHLRIAGADPQRGQALVRAYGCGSCHTIPGIAGARGVVGPSLENYAQRRLLAGIVPNVPRQIVSWLVDPPALVPETGMPAMGLTAAEARDVAAFLYTLGAEGARLVPNKPLPANPRL